SQPNWRWDVAFNPAGGVAALVTPGGAALNLNYDALGRFGGTENYAVTREPGAPVMTVNGAQMTFDPLFRLREAVSADGGVTTYDYITGRRSDVTLTVTNDAERVYTFSPGDGSTRRRSVTLAADGRTLSYFYNAEGLIEEIRFDLCLAEDGEDCGSTNTWTGAARIVYDAQGRPSRIIDEEQNIEIFSYDDVGNLLTYQSANGRTFTYQYDTLNRLTGVTGVTGISYLLRYDPLGNLAGLCRIRAEFAASYDTCREAGGELAVYSYDALGRLVQQRYPSSGAPDGEAVINYTYNGGLLSQWGQGESQVTLDYTADALALLKAVSYSGGSVVFDYDSDYRLLRTSEGTGYSYDPLGRLSAVRALGRSLAIDYAPDRQGYTATDEASGASITVALDERGLLRALEYAAMLGQPAAGDAQADFRYVIDPRNTALLGSVMTSGDEQRLIDQQVNRTNQTQNLVLNYGDDRLLLDYVTNPAGRVNRQRVDGSPETFFVQETQGYIQVVGYNDDDRASTVRVNAKNDGALLYVANFTYNDSGLRATETRRFSDSTQMTIQYEYGSRQQLTRRLVTMRWERRQETFEYLYNYDAAGNLLRIETIRANRPQGDNLETCATFTYDSLNRLTGAQIDGRRYLYEYDIYNRLIRANNLSLVYAGDTPLAAINPLGLTTFYAGLDDRPLLFFGEAGRAVWLVPDGRDSALGIAGSDDALTLLDPLGRPIVLEAPPSPDAVRPCSLTPVSSDLNDLAYPQPGLAGMLWHPTANLYFQRDGRVYQPEIGQFLQRDPAGARLNMGPYEFSRREPAPVQLRSGPAFMTGLRKLNSALAYSGLAQDADAVRTAHYPSLDGATLWTSPLSTRSPLSPALERLLSLPGWLRSGYNLPGAQVDALTGRLTLRPDSAPAQTVSPFESQLPEAVTWLPEGAAPVSARVQRLMGALQSGVAPVDDYRSLAWANSGGTLQALWTPPMPARPGSVSAVLAWLPNGLTSPQDARAMLDLMAGMLKLPRMTGMDWLESLLATALPSLPDTPPQTAAALRARYFADDLPSALALPAYRLPLPEAPSLPQYGIGHDDNWLFP
ncbi:MAG TPA: hypothetical protein PKX07_14785, partial [Aggregatilineales bacterium]|nr:hypothetical protein [Aggregatilineales bacterium]